LAQICEVNGPDFSSFEWSREWGRVKPEKVARIAAARKLLLIAHAIYKSGEPYHDPTDKEG